MKWYMIRRIIIGRYEAGRLTIDEAAAMLRLTHQCEARTKEDPECKPWKLLTTTGKKMGRPRKIMTA